MIYTPPRSETKLPPCPTGDGRDPQSGWQQIERSIHPLPGAEGLPGAAGEAAEDFDPAAANATAWAGDAAGSPIIEPYTPTATAIEREDAVRRVRGLMAGRGLRVSAACREAGVKRTSFDRWAARYDAGGIEALDDNFANCGRRPMAVLDEAETRLARQLYVQTGSATAALRTLASRPDCRAEVAEAILKRRRSKHTLTPTLRGQLTAVPQAVRDWHKSPTRVRREAFINPRTLTYISGDGTERRIEPGDLAERDDMSNNFLFWIEWPWGGDPCSDKYGVRIARGQNLLHIDVGSLRFLSMLMLVRLRDSYRADDIWQWVGQGYRDLGMPRIGERWERGIWQAHQLHGAPIEAGHTSQDARLGGIAALGRRIITSQSPTTKIIENRFRYLQRVCNDIPGQIGATRGEIESVNKLWTACRAGRRDPRDHFLPYEDIVARLEAKLQWCNSEPVEGSIYRGIPNEVWLREGGDARMTRLRPDQAYLFCRDRSIVTVTKGHALVRATAPDGRRQAWYFHHPELWRHDGQRVALYFDKYAPAGGAYLVHADGPRANQAIGPAELVEGCPQFAMGLDTEGDAGARAVAATGRRADFTRAVRAEYRALGLRHTIARGSYTSDGGGRATRAERPAPEAAAHREPARRKAPEPDIDPDELDRLEREAVARGDIILA